MSIGDQTILEHVNLHIHCGSLTAVIGRNGAGKSTLMKLMVGLLKPSDGKVMLKGQSVGDTRPEKLSRYVSLVYQNPEDMFIKDSIENDIAFAMRATARRIGKSGRTDEIFTEDMRIQTEMIRLNCEALTRMCGICMQYFSKGSRIINLSSAAALSSAEICGLCGDKILCTPFFQSAGRGIKIKRDRGDGGLSGTGRYRIFQVSGAIENAWKNGRWRKRKASCTVRFWMRKRENRFLYMVFG